MPETPLKKDSRSGAQVLDAHPELVADTTTGEDLEVIKQYRELLRSLNKPFPSPFILQDVLDAHPENMGVPPPREPKPKPPEKKPDQPKTPK